MVVDIRPKSKSEKGHAKFLESLNMLLARGETLDEAKLKAPSDLKIDILRGVEATAVAAHEQVGVSKGSWRTVTQDRNEDADLLNSKASQSVAFLDSRGANVETVEQARFYVRKLQGVRSPSSAKPGNSNAPDESAKAISASQQSNAARIMTFKELVEFLALQPEYQDVTNEGFSIAELRAFADSLQTKHNLSITAAAKLEDDRAIRDNLFYLAANSVLILAKRYKRLVFGSYGSKSAEYKDINSIPFQKPSK
jgi:hypothetical protein